MASGSNEGTWPWEDHTIRLWDPDTGKEKAALPGHTEEIASLSFSPDGQVLASGSRDKKIRLWNLAAGKLIAVLTGHTEEITSVSFSADRQTLASGSDDRTIRLWDLTTNRLKAVLVGHAAGVASLSFSPDGQVIASGSDDGMIRLWDLDAGNDSGALTWLDDAHVPLSFSPDGQILAVGSKDNTIRLWDLATRKTKAVLAGHKYESILSLSFSPDGRTLAAGSTDKTIRLWNPTKHREKAVLAGHDGVVSDLTFSTDGETLASVSGDATVFGGQSDDNAIRLWDLASGKEKATLAGHTGMVRSLSLAKSGDTLASGSDDKTIRLWDLASGGTKAVLAGSGDMIVGLGFAADAHTLASVSADQTIRLWDVVAGKRKAAMQGYAGWSNEAASAAFSPDGQTLATGANNGVIRLRDILTGKEKAILMGHTNGVCSLIFSPDGRILASASHFSASDDDSIQLWNLEFLSDPRSIEEQIKAAEGEYNLHLVGLEMEPLPRERNLYGVKPQAPRWSRFNPYRWLPAAEQGDANAMLQLGIVYDRVDDLERAETWYIKAAEAGASEASERLESLRRQQANDLWWTFPDSIAPEQFDHVLEVLSRIVALHPDDAYAYELRGRILNARKEYRQAEGYYRKALALNPQVPEANGNLGKLLLRQGRFDEALPLLKQAHELDPQSYAWALELGHVYLLRGDHKTARDYYEEALRWFTNEAALKSGPLADLQLFIAKGWQPKACKEEAAWFHKRFTEVARAREAAPVD